MSAHHAASLSPVGAEDGAPLHLFIPAAHHGPRGRANGGFAAGTFASLVSGPAAVRLVRPVPLERTFDVQWAGTETGPETLVLAGGQLVAQVSPCPGLRGCCHPSSRPTRRRWRPARRTPCAASGTR